MPKEYMWKLDKSSQRSCVHFRQDRTVRVESLMHTRLEGLCDHTAFHLQFGFATEKGGPGLWTRPHLCFQSPVSKEITFLGMFPPADGQSVAWTLIAVHAGL